MAPRVARAARTAVARIAKKVPGSRRLVQRVDQVRKARPLRESGLFDVAWYQAQTTAATPDSAACVRHYLAGGWRAGISINPLFDPTYVGRTGWATSVTDPVWEMLRDRTLRPTHPLFDPSRYLAGEPGAEQHPGGPLGHFLARASAGTALPAVPELAGVEPLTWGDVRPQLVDAARRYAHDQHLDRNRMSRTWDRRAEQALIARAMALPLPTLPALPALPTLLGMLDDAPLVSIVMPVRDRATQVPVAIRSIQAQSFGGWELVVVDDGSTDDTRAVLADLAAADSRIVVLEREALGVCQARNEGIARCRGAYVAFLDSDNQWTEQFLDVMLRLMAGQQLRAAYCALEGTRDGLTWYRAFDGGLAELLVHNHIDLNAFVTERELLLETGGFDPSLRRSVDWDLTIKIAKICEPVLLPFIGVRYDDDRATADRITTRELASWGDRVLDTHLVDWPRLRDLPRVAGRVSVVMPTYDDWAMTVPAVCAVLSGGPGAGEEPGVEVVVVDNGSSRVVWSTLQACFGGHPQVTLVRNVRNLNFALGSNTGVAASTGDTIAFLNNDTTVSRGWLGPLTATLAEPDVLGTQPLLLFPDGSIQCAGVVFPGLDGLPVQFLAHHPEQDALRGQAYDLSAVTGAATVVRASDVLALGGFDPLYTNGWEDIDLCLRLAQLRPGRFVVRTDSLVTHHESKTPGRGKHNAQNRQTFTARWLGRLPGEDRAAWALAGFEVVGYLPDAVDPSAADPAAVPRVGRPLLRRLRPAGSEVAAVPSLRWALKVADGPTPDDARALGDALGTYGQDVVLDRPQAHQRATSYLDDVVVDVGGRLGFVTQPGRVNLLWVTDVGEPAAQGQAHAERYHGVVTDDDPAKAAAALLDLALALTTTR